jgi:sulfite exporter TauE/SafE
MTAGKKRRAAIIAVIAAVIAAAAAAFVIVCLLIREQPLGRLFSAGYMLNLLRPDGNASILTVAVYGLLTSFHCVGMCGGLIVSQCAGKQNRWLPAARYNLGRVISYTLVGFVIGLVGSVLGKNPYIKTMAPLLAALIMIVTALQLFGALRWLQTGGDRLPVFFGRLKNWGPFAVGLLTGIMPCGMLQMVQMYALSVGNAFSGALVMFVFAVCSSSILLAIGFLSSFVTARRRGVTTKLAALTVLYMSAVMILRSLQTMGVL